MPVNPALLAVCIVFPAIVICCVIFSNYLNRHQLVQGTERFEPAKANEICIALQTVPPCHLRGSQVESLYGSQIIPMQPVDIGREEVMSPQTSHTLKTVVTASQTSTELVASNLEFLAPPDVAVSPKIKGSRARTRPLNASSYYSPFDDVADASNPSLRSLSKSGRSELPVNDDVVHLLRPAADLEYGREASASLSSDSLLYSPGQVDRYSWEDSRAALNKLSTITEVVTRPSDPESLSQIRPQSPESLHQYDRTYDKSRDSSVRGPYHYDYV